MRDAREGEWRRMMCAHVYEESRRRDAAHGEKSGHRNGGQAMNPHTTRPALLGGREKENSCQTMLSLDKAFILYYNKRQGFTKFPGI
jgi:hypothetical protein